MKKNRVLKALLCALIFLLIPTIFVYSQNETDENGQESEEQEIQYKMAEADAGDDIEQLAGKKVSFAAKEIKGEEYGAVSYHWDFGDGQFAEGRKVEHLYQTQGDYKVALTVKNEAGEDYDEILVKIFEDVVILLADKTPTNDELQSFRRNASRERVLLFEISDTKSNPDYITEGALTDSLLENSDMVRESYAVVSWTGGSLGLSALSKFAQKSEDLSELEMSEKAVLNISEGGFGSLARYAQSTFDVLNPKYILLTNKVGLNAVVIGKSADGILEEIRSSGINHTLISFYSERAIGELGITNFMSYTINYLINRGVSTDNILLMLMLPIIATIIAFSRQFLGIKTFGIYTPTIITLSFLATGLKYGLSIFIAILIVATLARLILRRFRLLYLPRMAIVLTIVSFAIIAMFVIGAMTDRTGIIGISFLPILVLIILVEKFIAVQIEKGPKTAILLSLETILVSVVCYFIASWNSFTTFILAYPEVILLTFVINALMGKWVGLRISEYFRFREIRKLSKKSKKKK